MEDSTLGNIVVREFLSIIMGNNIEDSLRITSAADMVPLSTKATIDMKAGFRMIYSMDKVYFIT
jgi:hypothetical protein